MTKSLSAALSRSIVNSFGPGALPLTSEKLEIWVSSTHPKASCGGPAVSMVVPSALIGWTLISSAS